MKLFAIRNIRQRPRTFHSGYQSLSDNSILQGERGDKSFQAYLELWKVRWKIGDPVTGSQLKFIVVLCTLPWTYCLQHSLVFTFVLKPNLYLNDSLFHFLISHGITEESLRKSQKGKLTKWPLNLRAAFVLKSQFQNKSEVDKGSPSSAPQGLSISDTWMKKDLQGRLAQHTPQESQRMSRWHFTSSEHRLTGKIPQWAGHHAGSSPSPSEGYSGGQFTPSFASGSQRSRRGAHAPCLEVGLLSGSPALRGEMGKESFALEWPDFPMAWYWLQWPDTRTNLHSFWLGFLIQ